jgi:hypothetical protein
VCREMDKRFSMESKSCLLSFGWGVSAEGGGEEKEFFRRGHNEYPVLRVACVDVGSAIGFPGRARIC